MGTNKIYFRGLNELRAIAAISVIFYHIHYYLPSVGLADVPFMKVGNAGVTLFFVLSGFLITYLLLDEKETQNNVSIKNFYLRRILRIWPLYFLYIGILVILFLTGVIKLNHNFPTLLFYIFFLGNVPMWLRIEGFPLVGHFWSLGVEEQFYAFWPWIVKKSRNVFRAIFLIWAVYFVLKIVSRSIEILNNEQDTLFHKFINVFCFGIMAIGGMAACALYYKKNTILKIVYYPLIQILAWVIYISTAFNFINSIIPSVILHDIFGAATAVIILNTVSNPKPLFRIYNRALDFLGKISFGLYVYHSLVLYIRALS